MSALLGADPRRVDLIAEGLHGNSREIQSLRDLAERALVEMRNAWRGQDFERLAQCWEQEAGPRLDQVSRALSTMASTLRAEAEEQRHTSGGVGGLGVPGAGDGRLARPAPRGPFNDGGSGPPTLVGGRTQGANLDQIDPADVASGHLAGWEGRVRANGQGEGVLQHSTSDTIGDNVGISVATGQTSAAASLGSLAGGDDAAGYELSAGKVEARADYSVDVDAHGNVVASVGATAGAYLAYASGRVHGGSALANGTVEGKAYAGAEVIGDASGSIGRDGAKAHLAAEAFAGVKAVLDAGGTVAGVSAAAGAEVSLGVGAHAEVDAELSLTGVGVSVDVGAALGIGAGVSFDVSVNPQEVMAEIGHAVDDIGAAAEGVAGGLASVGEQIAGFVPW